MVVQQTLLGYCFIHTCYAVTLPVCIFSFSLEIQNYFIHSFKLNNILIY